MFVEGVAEVVPVFRTAILNNQGFYGLVGSVRGDSGGLAGFGQWAYGIHHGNFVSGEGVFTVLERALSAPFQVTLMTTIAQYVPVNWSTLKVGTFGKCMDVPNGQAFNGRTVQQYGCTGSSPQQWGVVPTNGASGPGGAPPNEIKFWPNTNYCLDLKDFNTGNNGVL